MKYTNLLDDILVPFIEDNMGDAMIFQQKNACIYISEIFSDRQEDKDSNLLLYPFRSLDLDPIGNVLNILASKI